SLGHASSSGAGFFSIDLENPFPFSLAAEMEDVDVGRLLRGMFNSDFANEGRLEGKFRLDGEFDKLLKVRGSGEFEIKDSSLWAIPAFQALFSRLGFDTAAIFSRMESRYNIENGVVYLSRMRIKSDVLSLIGEGTVDFDGRLHHDLQVRYSLVDRLGPFTRLLYFIQNSLLRIGIRGDMSRPEIVVKGILSGFFGSSELGQRLPLPAYGGLPVRY
ncbi:MAG: AsmA-like C-terminal region-containing protein, partial [Planctomycetota bacterium]